MPSSRPSPASADRRGVAPTPGFLDEQARTYGALRRLDPILQIRSRMREIGLSSTGLAERLGVSEANVSRLLKGEQNLTLDTLYRLADAVEAPLTVLLKALPPTVELAPRGAPVSGAFRSAVEGVGAVERPPSLAQRRLTQRTDETVDLAVVPAQGMRPMSRAQLAQRRTVPSEDAAPSVPPLVAERNLAVLSSWLAQPDASDVQHRSPAVFVACLRSGWVEGAQAVWDSRRMNLMDGLLTAWGTAAPGQPLPPASQAMMNGLTWDPVLGAPMTPKAQAMVWPMALGRLWAEQLYDLWHEALQRSTHAPLSAQASRLMQNNVWSSVYGDLYAPEEERARAVRALIAVGLPLPAPVVITAYTDQDPLLPVLLEHPAPGLGTLQASLLLCQAGIVNRRMNVPRAQRERFETAMLRWGAEPAVTITRRDLEQLGPLRFFSAGYLRVDGPRGLRNQTWQDEDMAPILTSASPDSSETLYVGAHWRIEPGWDKAQRATYVREFEQRVLRTALPQDLDVVAPSARRRL